jgi:CCR4-NOT transcription complex subunit 1
LIQYSPEKPTVVRNILSRIIYCLHNSHADGTSFDQRPYLRLLVGLLKLFQSADPVFDVQQMLLLLEFRDAFHFLRPAVYPGFVFAWLELVSHRMFMPKILADPQGWPFVAELLIDFFSFVAPWLKEAQMNPAIHLLYQGILRVLLVLLHDFPEFLCDYHYNFCDVIPQTCIQMRNLILSAFPHSMKLPDPFIPNLKLDLLPEIKDPPRIKSDFYSAIQKVGLIAPLDAFIKTGKPVTFLADLLHILKTTGEDESYNVKAINSIVLYIGTRAIAEVAYQRGELSPLVPMEIFRYLTFNFDNEGRYILFNAIANQLRYPNNHTYYFSCVLLFLFAEASQEIIQEQITRILVERLIVHRPHPWGLLVTFVELVKNQRYNFWGRAFTRCAPEIERLFIQVGTHIAQHKGVP